MIRSSRLLVSLALLSVVAPAAFAQQPVPQPAQQGTPQPPVSDSLLVETDSAAARRNWLGSLLRRVTLRGDATADSLAAVDSMEAAVRPRAPRRVFNSRRDRLEYESARAVALRASGYRIVVDISDHRLYVIDDNDTLMTAPVATAKNTTLTFNGRSWRFETPRGVRTVLAKDKDPVWTPPDWHYAEVATENGLKMRHLSRGQTIRLRDGTRLMTKGDEVGVILPEESEFVPLVLDAHIVFDNTIFVPPAGTKHRTIQGELGHFRLKLGDGYQLHGTPYAQSIGAAVTHGCVRLGDEDIEWLFANVPVGTKVYLY
ncbi:MAG: L,D-transpeptidase family protein [Gemmatimonadaceae bacterium]